MVLRILVGMLLYALILGPGSAEGGRRFYQWTDDEGNTYFSDQLPIEAMRRGHRVVDEHGMTVEYREPPKSAAERAREREAQQAREKQARKDRELLLTYHNEAQLIDVRDKRLESADTIIAINTRQLAELETQLVELEAQIRARQDAERPVPERLRERHEALATRVANKRGYLEQRQRERQRIVEQFAADLARFRELQRRR